MGNSTLRWIKSNILKVFGTIKRCFFGAHSVPDTFPGLGIFPFFLLCSKLGVACFAVVGGKHLPFKEVRDASNPWKGWRIVRVCGPGVPAYVVPIRPPSGMFFQGKQGRNEGFGLLVCKQTVVGRMSANCPFLGRWGDHAALWARVALRINLVWGVLPGFNCLDFNWKHRGGGRRFWKGELNQSIVSKM